VRLTSYELPGTERSQSGFHHISVIRVHAVDDLNQCISNPSPSFHQVIHQHLRHAGCFTEGPRPDTSEILAGCGSVSLKQALDASTVVAAIDGRASAPTDSCLVHLPLGGWLEDPWGWPRGSFCADIELVHTIDTIVPSIDAPSSVGYAPTSPTCILKVTCSTYLECHPMSVSTGARTCVFHPESQRCVFCSFALPQARYAYDISI
jgi:hypothetical protein